MRVYSLPLLTQRPSRQRCVILYINCILSVSILRLQAHHQERLQQQLQQFLQAATSTLPDVSFETALADPDSDLAGSVLVKLTSFSNLPDSSAPAEERARFQRRMVAAWQDATALVARMLSSSTGAAADAAAAAVDLPRLCLVHMSGSCSTRLALCRRRTTSKLLRRSGKVGYIGHAWVV
jgi:hypothetical protein